jgi:hypothetical protein
MDNADYAEEGIQKALQAVCPRAFSEGWNDDTRRWTTEVKEALTRLGKELGYCCNASGVDTKDGGEWLFDVTWTEYDGEYLISVPLACESQWGTARDGKGVTQDFVNDFEKLLAARAEHKLMVMDQRKADTVDDTIDSLIERIKRIRLNVEGERYMFACWVNEQNVFTFRTYVTQP